MANESSVATTVRAPTSGRLAILTGLSLAASAIPVPFLPDRVVSRIRGAIAQDVASRHGLSITSDARRILAEASNHLTPEGALVVEVGTGKALLEQDFPDLPFVWLDTQESEGEVFMLSAADLGVSPGG